jgi:hypothetical protein
MHWQNAGLDIETSAAAKLQVWFGAGPFSFDPDRSFSFSFQFVISAGQTSNEFLALR